MVVGFYKRRRDARAEAAAKRAQLQRNFESFLRETEPLVPQGSYAASAGLTRFAISPPFSRSTSAMSYWLCKSSQNCALLPK